ncbi:MAG: helix-hairpin-helix domain-containing protein, partial [Cytophagales bacterium]|nr:helix-hairpin-helix domain-containing protein [Cytophagales bacterium]
MRVLKSNAFIYLLMTLGVLLLPLRGRAQEHPRKEINLDEFIQNVFGQPTEDVPYEDLYESLFQLYTNPLDLNDATRDELAATYILSEVQLNAFIAYRTQNGPLLAVYELQAIPDFDLTTIHRLLPFVEVRNGRAGSQPFWQRLVQEPNNYLLLRYGRVLEQKKGFSPADTNSRGEANSRYLGDPGQVYTRFRVSHARDFSFGFTLEKDAGEAVAWQPGTRRYFSDFISFHGMLENRGRWKKLLLGDYQLQAGQGLLLGAGFVMGKGAETITTVRRNQLGIRPYTSAMESGYFRGGAATYALGPFDLTGFYSNTRRDAAIPGAADSLGDFAGDAYIRAVQGTGYHRTAREIAARGNLREGMVGSNVTYRNPANTLQLGATALLNRYSVPLVRKPADYNGFEFNGRDNWNAGLSYSYLWQNVNLFGEMALSKSGGTGLVSGLIASLSPKVDLTLLYRRYDRHFHSFYGNAFGENTRNGNERGLYWGLKIIPLRKITLSAYYDQFRFPWLKYRVDAPSNGYEYLLKLAWQPTKTTGLYAQFREESKENNQADGKLPINFLAAARRRNWVLNADYAAGKHLTLQTRVQGSRYRQSNGPTRGYAIMQDVQMTAGKLKV